MLGLLGSLLSMAATIGGLIVVFRGMTKDARERGRAEGRVEQRLDTHDEELSRQRDLLDSFPDKLQAALAANTEAIRTMLADRFAALQAEMGRQLADCPYRRQCDAPSNGADRR